MIYFLIIDNKSDTEKTFYFYFYYNIFFSKKYIMADSINAYNNFTREGQQLQQANRETRNILAGQAHESLQNVGIRNTIDMAGDIAGLGEKGREFGEKVDTYYKSLKTVAKPEVESVVKDVFKTGKKSVVKDVESVAEDTSKLGKFGRFMTKGAIIGTAGLDLAQDFSTGHFKVAGKNWMEQTENVGNIIGGTLETAGMVMPVLAPELELGGLLISGVGDIVGDVGDFIEGTKEKKEAQTQVNDDNNQPTTSVVTSNTGTLITQKAQSE